MTTLRNYIAKRSLDNLQDNFVITLIDKANDKIAIICKRFYMQILLTEVDTAKRSTQIVSMNIYQTQTKGFNPLSL